MHSVYEVRNRLVYLFKSSVKHVYSASLTTKYSITHYSQYFPGYFY